MGLEQFTDLTRSVTPQKLWGEKSQLKDSIISVNTSKASGQGIFIHGVVATGFAGVNTYYRVFKLAFLTPKFLWGDRPS